VRALYLAVVRQAPGLARTEEEITAEYVCAFIGNSLAQGVFLVVEDDEDEGLAGEIHTYRNGLRRFSHVLGSLTTAVHPSAQRRGIGRQLFAALLSHVTHQMPDIERVELLTQESHERAIALYESMGFHREGRLERGIRNADGGLEADIPMAWLRPASHREGNY
jgi:ribosomal protein S18 acetylase RimI-like enzyme